MVAGKRTATEVKAEAEPAARQLGEKMHRKGKRESQDSWYQPRQHTTDQSDHRTASEAAAGQ